MVVLYPQFQPIEDCVVVQYIFTEKKKNLHISTLTQFQPVWFTGPLYHIPKFMGYNKSSSKREVYSNKEKEGVPGQSSG